VDEDEDAGIDVGIFPDFVGVCVVTLVFVDPPAVAQPDTEVAPRAIPRRSFVRRPRKIWLCPASCPRNATCVERTPMIVATSSVHHDRPIRMNVAQPAPYARTVREILAV
jgi:hypothetical protein